MIFDHCVVLFIAVSDIMKRSFSGAARSLIGGGGCCKSKPCTSSMNGLNTKPASKQDDPCLNSRADDSVHTPKSFTGYKAAVVAKSAAYYDSCGREVNAVSASKRDTKRISSSDSVPPGSASKRGRKRISSSDSVPPGPQSDAVAEIVSLQSNNDVTKKKKKKSTWIVLSSTDDIHHAQHDVFSDDEYIEIVDDVIEVHIASSGLEFLSALV